MKKIQIMGAALALIIYNNTIQAKECTNIDYMSIYETTKDFSNKQLQCADFDGLQLQKSNFQESNITDGTFKGAQIQEANFENAILENVDFTGAQARIANVYNAKNKLIPAYSGAFFTYSGANFTGANLKNTTWNGAHIEGATFRGANLTGAEGLSAAVCKGPLSRNDRREVTANFSGATWIDGEKCEEGSFGYCKRTGKSSSNPKLNCQIPQKGGKLKMSN